ncbi:Uncharacterized conserved protein YeaO, DUF488 family [Dyadobacter soli]|uniref:Uncharacterized conserved protein YeaO, DUF488 family n=1 Tax=Dyadobacter soli TaxID=659014 RepID=A0A1G6Y457_9BACT|nr:DUF488 family protein [Dyadobacter soli]SDD84497.1 Uncharacterized conserved protein YeaO, DUF488 family [Dyadobacter soli]
MAIRTKRIYEPAAATDGYRVLVDRLWPRGLTKEAAGIDRWLKEVAPSDALRKWFHANMDEWDEFKTRYKAELKDSDALHALRSLVTENEVVTLLFSAKTEDRNQALVLKELLEKS